MSRKNLVITFGSAESLTSDRYGMHYALNDVEIEELLDEIGIEAVMKHFELVRKRPEYFAEDEPR